MIAIGSDVSATLSGHQDTVTGSYINTAVVTASVLDGSTSLFSVTLNYLTASNGNYRAAFTGAQTSTLTPGQMYTVAFVATSASGTLTIHDSHVANYSV